MLYGSQISNILKANNTMEKESRERGITVFLHSFGSFFAESVVGDGENQRATHNRI